MKTWKAGKQSQKGAFLSGFGLIATGGADVKNYTDKNVLSRATYHYYVRAVNGSGASNPSNTASVTVK